MKTTNMRFFNQNGLTLVEILVAMVLGTFLIGGVLEVYLSNKQTSLMQNNLSELQENGRAAMNILARDIRMAGYHRDFSFDWYNLNIVDNLPIRPSNDSIVSGVDSGQPNYWTPAQQAAVVPDTDVITIMFARPCGGKLQPPGMTNPNSPIPISTDAANNCNINAGDAVFITNNSKADIFLATNSNDTNITHARLSTTYGTRVGAGSEVFAYFINSYYIGMGANNRPALFRFDNVRPGLGTSVQELIEGIEDMQILYGINTDVAAQGGDIAPNFYVNADGIGLNAKDIVSVKISLVLVSTDEVAQKPIPYTLNGVIITPNDRRLRRVFSSVIFLRNRLPTNYLKEP